MHRQPGLRANRIRESQPRLIAALQWALLFLGLFVAIWLATQSRAAPQIILLTMLGVIAANFSIPAGGLLSPILPIVSFSGLLVAGLWPAVAIVAGAVLLAELALPLWTPLWENTPLGRSGWRQRIARGLIHILALLLATSIHGTVLPLGAAGLAEAGALADILFLSLTYAGLLSAGFILLNWIEGRRMGGDTIIMTLMVAFLSQPFALLGAITFSAAGLPAFVIFCVGAGAFAIVSWMAWHRHYVLQQQLGQISALNTVGTSLRETLDLPTVLERTHEQARALIAVDAFTIILGQEDGSWHRAFHVADGRPQGVNPGLPLDDCTRWVLEEGRVLELNPENVHHASTHGLSPPPGGPSAWMGVPLTTGSEVIGAIIMQRFEPGKRFGRWSREVVMAIAGQASAAVENARLHGRIVDLYNQTDQALAQRVRQLQSLLNSTREAVLMLDTGGRVVLVNPPAAQLLGRTQDELQGRRIDPDLASEALGYNDEGFRRLLEHLRQGKIPARVRTVFRGAEARGDGKRQVWKFIERNGAPVLSAEEVLIGWLSILRDVTEEQERQQWRTNLTRMIVHDLRNPVTTLISDLDSMETARETGQADRFQQKADQARRGCYDMLDMIDSLMDVTRLEAGQVVVDADAMHVLPLVEALLDRLRAVAGKKEIATALETEPELPPVWADAEILRRVFVNLLDNALKFTPSGGAIAVRLEADRALPGHAPGVRCSVVDSGPGIPPEHRERIFERFTQVNPGGGQVRGTGLGLTFCKLAVEAQGGRIWVEESSPTGTAFAFTVPGIPDFDRT